MDIKSAEKAIKNGWIAALVSAMLTGLLASLPLINESDVLGFNPWNFLDVVLMICLAFGVYKKSKTAATILFAYFVISKIDIIVFREGYSTIPVSLIFLYFYFQAMRGTYSYENLMSESDLGAE